MGGINKKINNLEDALTLFEQSAILHRESTVRGDPSRKINKYYDTIIHSVRWLYQNKLLIHLNRFYSHPNFGVKSWAARFLLEIDTINAEKALEELVSSNYFNAKYVLMEWREGTLDMDFFKK